SGLRSGAPSRTETPGRLQVKLCRARALAARPLHLRLLTKCCDAEFGRVGPIAEVTSRPDGVWPVNEAVSLHG
ncbi:MAG TPA: hypothetical protein VK148_32240, partial [Xanthobacteraceae bacterium]|nr:hypothetical protein [Xanthobacteraceae bacterium]